MFVLVCFSTLQTLKEDEGFIVELPTRVVMSHCAEMRERHFDIAAHRVLSWWWHLWTVILCITSIANIFIIYKEANKKER